MTDVADWDLHHLRSFGYIKQVCWFEAGRTSPSGKGIFCFSTPEAEDMFNTINELVGKGPSPLSKRQRLSRRYVYMCCVCVCVVCVCVCVCVSCV
jgi:hypothetical protein